MKLVVILASAALLLACHYPAPVAPSPHTPPGVVQDIDIPAPLPVVSATGGDDKACATMHALGCSDAIYTTLCLATFQHARTNETSKGSVDLVSACAAAAASLDVVRACGGPSTLTFDCP